MSRNPLNRLIVWITIGLLLLSACSAGGSPAIEATRGWLQALADLDFKQVMELTCSNAKARDAIETRLEPFMDIQETLQALKGQFDFSGLKFEEIGNDGRTATVRVSGKMLLKALGQSQALDVYENIAVAREGDNWKVCAGAANLLNF
jgi:hypothetical protein